MPTHKERFWATLAHVPAITIIWTSYLLYRIFFSHRPFPNIELFEHMSFSKLPITPIVLTLCSIPISLGILYLKGKSTFVRDNAQEAYHFNLWLLKIYIALLCIALLGVLFSSKSLTYCAGIIGLTVSLMCLYQSIRGISTTMQNRVYHYWYLGKNTF